MHIFAFPTHPTAFWITAALAVIILGMDKAGFGGGIGFVATPLMALTIPVSDAAALLLPLLMIADLMSLRHYHGKFDRKSIAVLLPGAILGTFAAAFVFNYFSHNERVLKIGLGILVLLFIAFQLGRALIFGALGQKRFPDAVGFLLGSGSGFTSTLVHAGSPFTNIYLLPQAMPRELFIGTTVILYALMNWIKLIPYAWLGLLRVGNLTTVLLLAPLAYVGVRLGLYCQRYFSDQWFHRLVYVLLFITGVQLIWRA
ncbi:MAG: sulfite exporter TauE/SafE family protein [Chloroflexi bacterium]|nr:sulfite exporter TauE/SafE family protein [Chloroflexota bacterium]